MSSMSGKQYGLILSKKKEAPLKITKPSVFDSGSDSEEDVKNGRSVKDFAKTKPKLKAQLEIQKALDEDPTVYEYDNVYDAMKEKKEAQISETTIDRKPKYIQNILKAADKRKKEYERRVERKIQKEREEEGEKFADKEAFVTTAYKKKMQELQEEEEKEKRMDVIEAMMDVTKQKDLSGFYRHLLNREVSDGEKSSLITNIKEEKHSSSEDDQIIKKSDVPQSGAPKCSTSSREVTKMADSEKRARETLQELRKGNNISKDPKPSEMSKTLDADSDFTSDSESSSSDSSDDERSQPTKKGESQSKVEKQVERRRSPSPAAHIKGNNNKSLAESAPKRMEKSKEDSESSSESENESNRKRDDKNNAEPVLSEHDRLMALFAKRTVGEAFTAAQERYWQRKRLKTSGLAATCA